MYRLAAGLVGAELKFICCPLYEKDPVLVLNETPFVPELTTSRAYVGFVVPIPTFPLVALINKAEVLPIVRLTFWVKVPPKPTVPAVFVSPLLKT